MEKQNIDGCYDINGRCVNCKCFHPCDCENVNAQIDAEIQRQEEDNRQFQAGQEEMQDFYENQDTWYDYAEKSGILEGEGAR